MGEFWSILKASESVLRTNPSLLLFISLVLDAPIIIFQLLGPLLIKNFKDDIVQFLVKLHLGVFQMLAFTLFLVTMHTFILVLFQGIGNSSLYFTMAHFYLSPSKPISKTEALNLSPKIWFRYWSTVIWCYLIYLILLPITMVPVAVFIYYKGSINPWVLTICIYVIFLPISVYVSLVTSLASVASVLQDVKGLKALKQGKTLLKGKIWLGLMVLTVPGLVFGLPLMYLMRGQGSLSLWKFPFCIVWASLTWLVSASLQVVFFFTCEKTASIPVKHEKENDALLKFEEFV